MATHRQSRNPDWQFGNLSIESIEQLANCQFRLAIGDVTAIADSRWSIVDEPRMSRGVGLLHQAFDGAQALIADVEAEFVDEQTNVRVAHRVGHFLGAARRTTGWTPDARRHVRPTRESPSRSQRPDRHRRRIARKCLRAGPAVRFRNLTTHRDRRLSRVRVRRR